jgi:Fic-DOC domain mobile mystery protein B
MTDLFHADDHATPLTPIERDGLIPTHVTLHSELNELEQKNIAEADSWAFARKRGVLGEPFLLGLHRRMFKRVWRWAGRYRKSDRTNLGIKPHLIQPELRQAIDDAQGWIDYKFYENDELAVRFHHRLVVIHPFPNGNGRWSRMAADLLTVRLGGSRFTWGSANLQKKGGVRDAYIKAMKAADNHDFTSLIAFARS